MSGSCDPDMMEQSFCAFVHFSFPLRLGGAPYLCGDPAAPFSLRIWPESGRPAASPLLDVLLSSVYVHLSRSIYWLAR